MDITSPLKALSDAAAAPFGKLELNTFDNFINTFLLLAISFEHLASWIEQFLPFFSETRQFNCSATDEAVAVGCHVIVLCVFYFFIVEKYRLEMT